MKTSYITLQTTGDSLAKISQLIQKFPKRCQITRQFQYYYIVDYILRNSDKNNNCVPLNRNTLATVLGIKKMYCSVMLQDLIRENIIEVIKYHNHGYNSTYYGIPAIYEDLASIKVKETEFPTLKKIITRRNQADGFKLTSDGQLYMNYVAKVSITSINEVYSELYNRIVFKPNGVRYLKIRKFKREKTNVKRIIDGDFWLKRPDEKSRVYCNLSILHREHRKYLRFDGKSLKCVDIRCSQPSLAGMMIKQRLLQSGSPIPNELDDYLKACTNGQFYELFMDGDEQLAENRKKFKQDFFKAVFFSRVTRRNNRLKKKFITRFPIIYDIICEMKGGLADKGDRTFAEFAKELQRFEASIIVDKVNLPMLREGYGCYNIYDSIVSHDDETLKEATRRITEEFEKLGFTPKINIEDFTKY